MSEVWCEGGRTNVTNIAEFRQKKEAREINDWRPWNSPLVDSLETYSEELLERALEKQFDRDMIILSELGDELLDMLQDYLLEPDVDLLREIEAFAIVVSAYHGMHHDDLLPDERLKYSCITWAPSYTATGQPR